MNIYNFCTYTKEQLEKEFNTSQDFGLKDSDIIELKKKYGHNAFEQININWFKVLIRQLASPLVYLLVGASIASLFLGDYINAGIIIFIVFINSFLSFIQEFRAEQSLILLRKKLSSKSIVLRNGKISQINSEEVVPGDIIYLKPGDYIPADIRFIKTDNIFIDESILTGESNSVFKSETNLSKAPVNFYGASNIGFLGTSVSSGTAIGIVLAIAKETTFGKIEKLTLSSISFSSFEERLAQLSKFILNILIITLIVLVTSNLIIKWQTVNIIDLLMFSIALTIGLIPEGLPTVITFALSSGALKMAKNKVVVKRLSSIEDLGSINLLCTDKTGTLTENKLKVSAEYTLDEKLKLFSVLSCNRLYVNIDPFDRAILEQWNSEFKSQKKEFKFIETIPFDPIKLRAGIILQEKDNFLIIYRGSYEKIVNQLNTENTKNINAWIKEQADIGNRVIAIYYKYSQNQTDIKTISEFDFAGLISFTDPIKPDAKDAIFQAEKLGVKIKMITGDGQEIACSVARAIGLLPKNKGAILGSEFESMTLFEKNQAVNDHDVFSRVTPEQKYEIVTLLTKNNIVGYLGDGINDAPALKIAHVGIVVNNSSDLAKDSADIVLLEKSLKVILNGISIGRGVFANTIKYITTVLTSNFGNLYSIAIASLILDFLPMLPIQILLLNLMSDIPMIFISTDNVDDIDIEKPYVYNVKSIVLLATTLGIVNSFFDFVFFAIFYKLGAPILQTNWFILNILTALILIYSIRTRFFIFKSSRPSNSLIIVSALSGLFAITLPYTKIGQDFFKFIPPTFHNILNIIIIVLSYFITTEIVKNIYYKHPRQILNFNNN